MKYTEEEMETIRKLSIKSCSSSSLELKDYPNMICFKKDVIILLNLIERQQKEIEEKDEKIRKAKRYCSKKSSFQTFENETLKNALETYVNATKYDLKEILGE